MRILYYLGLSYVGLCVALSFGALRRPFPPLTTAFVGGLLSPETPAGWFASVKGACNPVEIELRHLQSPPPTSTQGLGYSAACYALAGDVGRAREILLQVTPPDRWRAAGILFDVIHPVADAGDDTAAGAGMELVLEFWPNHYMALYHAGMSRYARGDHAGAGTLLQAFLDEYSANDGWTRNAETVLSRINR